MLAHCRETAIELLRSGLLGGGMLRCCFGLALSFSSQLRTFGSASKVISSWICFSDASSLVDGFAAFCVAAKPPHGSTAVKIIALSEIALASPAIPRIVLPSYIASSPPLGVWRYISP